MKKARELSTTQMITLGFLTTIVLGMFLLMLPLSSAEGIMTNPVDALFTAATSVCVTGLVVVDMSSYWSIFGQIVVLLLIQIGGLGVVTLTTSIIVFMGKKVNLKERLLLEDAYNLNTLSGLVRFMKKVLKGTLIVEGVGAFCYSLVFVPRFGFWKGLWVSLFNAVSAFCNAGIDIIGSNSLMEYVAHPWINVVTMLLIIIGGIGYIVWWDVLRVAGLCRKKEVVIGHFFRRLKLHTKLVLLTTGALILLGAIIVFVLEYSNPMTLGKLSIWGKIQAAFFQSVTLRTAGFATIPQQGLQYATSFISMILMFIGGSPAGTAGGIKTTTIAVLLISAFSTVKGEDEATVYNRTIARETIQKALAVTTYSLLVVVLAVLALLMFEQGSFIDVAYETISAIGTVGLSRNFTTSLDTVGRLLISLCMYLGRVGPMSMMIAFTYKRGKKILVAYAKEDVTVG